MEQIALYLKKFTDNVSHERLVRESIIDILKKYSGVPIPLENIHIKGNTLYIRASPVLKNILFIHKEDILKQLRECLEKSSISDVR
ncbi:MAG: hypothetical protein G01um101448_198 [Parcubacteria group bacterium Gr01-1014_48]|nr:MAG: hypothetical protein G01um101448_198 [Parcubacteria group bacterium Gr01-1014_48]TSD01022.1 MAG: hypothetical protein Greene101415_523 [Parcubacteria group bacterium Greene1014_15]